MKKPDPSAGREGTSGYTLVELLVVLTILGLIAALAAPQMIKYMEHGQRAAAATQSATLTASLRLFRADVGRYPTTAEGLDALLAPPADAENWSGPYVQNASVLNDPWGHRFIYRSPAARGEFDLFSAGPPPAKSRAKEDAP